MRALSEGAFRSSLTILDAGMCALTDAGARSVAGGLVGLSVLKLYDNEIGDDGVRVIARALPQLRHLNGAFGAPAMRFVPPPARRSLN